MKGVFKSLESIKQKYGCRYVSDGNSCKYIRCLRGNQQCSKRCEYTLTWWPEGGKRANGDNIPAGTLEWNGKQHVRNEKITKFYII